MALLPQSYGCCQTTNSSADDDHLESDPGRAVAVDMAIAIRVSIYTVHVSSQMQFSKRKVKMTLCQCFSRDDRVFVAYKAISSIQCAFARTATPAYVLQVPLQPRTVEDYALAGLDGDSVP